MSSFSKMTVDIGLRLASESKIDHIILASEHGEVENSLQLLKSIADREILSPTLFSQSVHNTSIGIIGLHTKNNSATTALSSKNGFIMGLLSALGFIDANPTQNVLFICADCSVPHELIRPPETQNIAFGLGLILNKASMDQAKIPFKFSMGHSTDFVVKDFMHLMFAKNANLQSCIECIWD